MVSLLQQRGGGGGVDGEKKDKAFTCTNLETFENISFKSNHEEADSRVWFHALACAGKSILIFSPDADTVHIGLPFIDSDCDKNVILQLSDRLGHQSFIDVNKLANCFRNDSFYSHLQCHHCPDSKFTDTET